MTTPNPFTRGYQYLYIRRELLITDDENLQHVYRQLTPDQEGLTNEQLAAQCCVSAHPVQNVLLPPNVRDQLMPLAR